MSFLTFGHYFIWVGWELNFEEILKHGMISFFGDNPFEGSHLELRCLFDADWWIGANSCFEVGELEPTYVLTDDCFVSLSVSIAEPNDNPTEFVHVITKILSYFI